MKHSTDDWLTRNNVFPRIALATVAILLIPLVAMQITPAVAWSPSDFLVMGTLLFGMASLFVLVARRAQRKHRLWVGAAIVAVFLYVWAELAVGVFTNFGS